MFTQWAQLLFSVSELYLCTKSIVCTIIQSLYTIFLFLSWSYPSVMNIFSYILKDNLYIIWSKNNNIIQLLNACNTPKKFKYSYFVRQVVFSHFISRYDIFFFSCRDNSYFKIWQNTYYFLFFISVVHINTFYCIIP